MITLRWLIAGILILISVYAVVGNALIAINWWSSKKRATMIPFIGGVAGLIGVLLLPIPRARDFWWLPPIVDLGCVLLMLAAALERLRRLTDRKSNPDNS